MAAKNKDGAFDITTVAPEHREQVEAMIPNPVAFEAYTQRELPGGFMDFDYFEAARQLRHNVLLVGPTGAGKTTAGRAYAAWLQRPFASVEFNGAMDPAATIGAMQVSPETGLPEWRWGELSLATMYGGVVFLDEVNFAPPRFTAAFHGVLDARQTLYVADLGTRVRKHPETLIIGAYNPRYVGTNLLNEAFTNRWALTIDPWGYDAQVEAERIGTYSPTLLRRVREMRQDPAIQGDIGTNAMEEFIHISLNLNIDAAISLFLAKLAPEDRGIADRVFEAEKVVIADELGADLADNYDEEAEEAEDPVIAGADPA